VPTDLYFIIGRDNLPQIPRWKDPAKLIKLCFLVAVPRPGYEHPNIKVLENEIPGISKKVILLAKPRIDISATDIRNRVAGGLDISGLVPEAVAEYIRENGLYLKKWA
jgi:nicotinate-nucleotide adenylyltransferase